MQLLMTARFVAITYLLKARSCTMLNSELLPWLSNCRKQRFIYSRSEGIFRKLDFPTKWTFKEYLKTQGYETEAKAKAAFDKWGKNAFEFPAPNFLSLYKEQCMEPFFVFQVVIGPFRMI
jgi:hypothetical protein